MGSGAGASLGIARVQFPVMTLGPGRRAVIWVQGCSIRCRGCVSVDTWNPASAEQTVRVGALVQWLESIGPSHIEGITISGGEPFDQPEALKALLEAIRGLSPLGHADLFAYSGYPLIRLRRDHGDILELIDAVMSGPFAASLPTDLAWQGSSNQRLTLLTERARRRFGDEQPRDRRLQVSADGGQLWITGIPKRGDMEALEAFLEPVGIQLRGVSWRQTG